MQMGVPCNASSRRKLFQRKFEPAVLEGEPRGQYRELRVAIESFQPVRRKVGGSVEVGHLRCALGFVDGGIKCPGTGDRAPLFLDPIEKGLLADTEWRDRPDPGDDHTAFLRAVRHRNCL